MALFTTSEINPWLGITTGDTINDTSVSVIINAVSTQVATICGQPVESASVVWPFDGNGLTRVTTGYHPITSIEALEYRYGVGSAQTWTAVASTDYDVTDNVVNYIGGFGYGTQNWRITMTVGYGAGSVPDDVLQVAREMCVIAVRESSLPGIGKHTLGIAAAVENILGRGYDSRLTFRDLMRDWRERLEPYRRTTGG